MPSLIRDLYNARAIQINLSPGGGWILKDRTRSPVYVNLRLQSSGGMLTQELVDRIGYSLWVVAEHERLEFDAVAGLPDTGIPLAEAFKKAALKSERDFSLIVLGKKGEGEGRRIERILNNGGAPYGATVLVIDDAVKSGLSKDEGIEALESEGYIVQDVLVYLDREQGGEAHLRAQKKHLHRVGTLREAIEELRGDPISFQDAEAVLRYLAAP